MWEITFVAAFAAAVWSPAFWIAAAWVIGNGLIDQLSLNAFGLQQFMSGSVHYVAGAQALVLVPLGLVGGFRAKTWWSRLAWGSLTGLALYSALISGARAVYVPLVVVLIATVVRSLWGRESTLKNGALVLGTALLVISALEIAQPYRPLLTTVGKKAAPELQVRSVGERGNFTQRLRFLEQTFDIVLAHPIGSGVGTFQAVINNYQKYPMVWSNSPHNYYVETLAVGGWPRMGLLLLLIGSTLLRAWRTSSWPWALAGAGVWATLAFDVTSYYPSFMMFAFLTLGAAHHRVRRPEGDRSSRSSRQMLASRVLVPVTCLAVGVALLFWWSLPCNDDSCFIDRYHGAEYLAGDYLNDASTEYREATYEELRRRYPESIWVLRIEQQYATDQHRKLALAAEIAQRFPLQSPFNYLSWAELALEAGDIDQAKVAISTGLHVFGPDSYPYGEFRMTRDLYQQWLNAASNILARVAD